ncbi:MAG: chorismate synthase, partial [Dehalococcoidia bacterium]
GSHVHWDRKLDGRLAQAIMSIHAVKGVEIGSGFALASTPGSQAHDVILPPDQWGGQPWRRASNRAGGLEGGMTNGEPVVVRAVLKPLSTLSKPLPSVDLHTAEEIQAHYERSDICTVPAAGVIGEAMVAIVLAQALLEKFGGDSLEETKRNYAAYMETVGPRGGKLNPGGEPKLVRQQRSKRGKKVESIWDSPRLQEMLRQPLGSPVNLTREEAIAIAREAFGKRPDLPPGDEYVRRLRPMWKGLLKSKKKNG